MRNHLDGQLLELRKQGLSAMKIGLEIGRSSAWVSIRLRELGVDSSNQRRIDWPVEQMRQWYEVEGKTVEQIGQLLGGRSGKLVNKVCKKHGFRMRRRGPKDGPEHTGWKGGRKPDKDGYILVYAPEHPHAANGYVREHRLVVEQLIGRYLLKTEVVHHKDDNRQNNHIDNLQLFASNADHLAATLKGKCPKWSAEGKAAILEAVRKPRKRKAIPPESKPDEPGCI